MAKRKKISASIRFEAFKRDSFKCQYCGRCAPEVVLELDHIEPHSKGGADDLLNLITSCWECNNGKSDRRLSDNTVLQKQRDQLEELQERREQLEMMLKWRSANADIEGDALKAFQEAYEDRVPGWYLNETGLHSARQLIKKFGLQHTLDALDNAAAQVIRIGKGGRATKESAGKMFGAIFINTEPPEVRELYRLRGRIRKRWNHVNDGRCISILRRLLKLGATLEDIEGRTYELINTSPSSFTEWCGTMECWIQQLNDGLD